MNPITIFTATLVGLLLCGCDRMQQQGPPPTYESSALQGIRATLPGSEPEAAASAAASAPAPK